MEWLLGGAASDFAAYREKVGRCAALEAVEKQMDDIGGNGDREGHDEFSDDLITAEEDD